MTRRARGARRSRSIPRARSITSIAAGRRPPSSPTRGRSIAAKQANGAAAGTRSSTIPTSHPDGHAARARHVHAAGRQGRSPSASASSSCSTACAWAASRARLAYTFYPGSRLIQQEAVLTTNDPDVAYYYDAGLDMGAPADRTPGNNMRSEIAYYDTDGHAEDASCSNGIPGRARAGAGPLQHAGGEDGRRQRCGVSGAAPVFLSARLLLESRVPLAPIMARRASASASAAARRELAVLPVGERAARTRPAHGRLLPRLPKARRKRRSTHVLRYTNRDRFPALAGYKTLSTHWHLADTVQAMAQRPPVDAAVQAGSEGDGRRCRDDHGLPRRRASRRPHGSAPRRARRLLQARSRRSRIRSSC